MQSIQTLLQPPIEQQLTPHVIPLAYEHDAETWKREGTHIVETLNQYPDIEIEYVYPELETASQRDPLAYVATKYKPGDRTLFKELPNYLKAGTNVWTADPAYNYVAAVERLGSAILSTALTASVAFQIIDKIAPVTRRQFLKLSSTGVLSLASVPVTMALENDIRRVAVATGILALCKQKHISAIPLLYPPTHLEMIQYYLRHEKARKKRMAIYQESLPLLQSVCTARCWVKSDGEWQKVEEIPY